MLMQGSSNFERVGDHAVNILEVAEVIENEKINFTDSAKAELQLVKDAVMEIVGCTVDAFGTLNTDEAKKIEPLEEVIDDMVVMLKDRHIERLKVGKCSTTSGMAFIDLLTNLEGVADQCSNIALLILSMEDRSILGNHHGYVHELHKGGDVTYDTELARQKKNYIERLNEIEEMSFGEDEDTDNSHFKPINKM
jgi:phosphate:Na+ symporter